MAAGFMRPVIKWDGKEIGTGTVGPVATALDELLKLDRDGRAQAYLEPLIKDQEAFGTLGDNPEAIQGDPSLAAHAPRWEPLQKL